MGDNALEIGPGYGANLRVLLDMSAKLTAVEIDAQMAQRLQRLYVADNGRSLRWRAIKG